MGYIYKITNMLNNKVYIGQTVKTVQKRFTQHKNNSNKDYFSQIVLYKAFNKYGFENFCCEEIEEVPNHLLDEREKYWIEYYDSYFNGYNSTLGGRATQLYEWDVDDIIERYLRLRSARKVAEEIGCDHNTIDRLLNQYGVKRFSAKEQNTRPVRIQVEKTSFEFFNLNEAASWIVEQGYSKTTNVVNVRRGLAKALKENRAYLGLNISEL